MAENSLTWVSQEDLARAVEAAYQEGFDDGFACDERLTETWRDSWEESEARKNLNPNLSPKDRTNPQPFGARVVEEGSVKTLSFGEPLNLGDQVETVKE